jgi:hypothetical protein
MEHHHKPTHADSTRTLSGSRQLWGHVGAGWLSAPAEVRKRYGVGIDLGASADRRFADRLALRGRAHFTDLPSTQPNAVVVNGVTYATNNDYGHGWLASGLASVALRPWRHFWFEGGLGGGYFNSGFSGAFAQDITTGKDFPLNATSGWGPSWGLGARYEFQPTLRDRLLAEADFTEMDRGERRLRFISIRFGYRAF